VYFHASTVMKSPKRQGLPLPEAGTLLAAVTDSVPKHGRSNAWHQLLTRRAELDTSTTEMVARNWIGSDWTA
jgi:hypothetical protein